MGNLREEELSKERYLLHNAQLWLCMLSTQDGLYLCIVQYGGH